LTTAQFMNDEPSEADEMRHQMLLVLPALQ